MSCRVLVPVMVSALFAAVVGCGDSESGDSSMTGSGATGNSSNGGNGNTGNTGNAGGNGGNGGAGNTGGASGGTGGDGGDGGVGGGSSGTVVVNEVHPSTSGDEPDWFELYNGSNSAVDLSGWTMQDDDNGVPDPTHVYTFPAGTTLAAGGYHFVERTDDPTTGFDFGLGGDDAVYLFDAAAVQVDVLDWVDSDVPDDQSYGHFPDGSGNLVTMTTPTKGAANTDQ